MKIGNFILDDRKVQKARAYFYRRRRGRRVTTDFDTGFDKYLGLFSQDCNSFADIARLENLTRQRVSQVYGKYYKGLFPGRPNGWARVKICTVKKHKALAGEVPLGGIIHNICLLAKENELDFQLIPMGQSSGPPFNRKNLIVNHKLCHVSVCSQVWRPSKNVRFISDFQDSRWQHEQPQFLIAVQNIPHHPKRYFILPFGELLGRYRQGDGAVRFTIPLEKLSVCSKHPRLDFWQYEDAWHLLK